MKLTVNTHFEPTQTQMDMIIASKKAQEREAAISIRRHKRDDESALYVLTDAGKEVLDELR